MTERAATAEQFRKLIAWAAGVRLADLPPAVIGRAASILGDDLSAIVSARQEPEVDAFHKKVLGGQRPGEATVFRGGRPMTDRFSAVVANGVAADWMELDEGYRKVSCHAGLYVVPALLCEAEVMNVPAGEALRSLAVAYEIVTRFARAWTPMNAAQHGHARYGAVGAAAVAGLLRNLPADRLAAVVASGATLTNAGPRSHVVAGALIRNVWPAMAAWSGLMSVVWEECGITGIAESPYDVFTQILGGTIKPELLTEGLGEEWAVLDGYTKIFACCQHTHAAVEATLALRPMISQLDDIASIEVETHPLAMPLSNQQPPTTLAGKFSMPHVVAVTLATGTAGAEAFAANMLEEPKVVGLRQRVTMRPYEPLPAAPNDRPSRITLAFRDGRRVTEEVLSAQGGPDRPFPPAVLDEKLAAMLAPVYPRFMPIFHGLRSADQAYLTRGWRDLVADFTA